MSSSKNPLLKSVEKRDSDFILSGKNSALSYQNLFSVINRVTGQLRSLKVKKNEVAAIVTRNGPNAATTFLATCSGVIAAPLNPEYTKAEFKFYIRDLQAKVLLVEAGDHCNARQAADELNVPVANIIESSLPGNISLSQNNSEICPIKADFNQTDDNALILHTSGTTSKPKIVPLTIGNLFESSNHIANTLQLNSKDRYFNIMPLFHIHGLVAGVLSTVNSGGSMICSKGFDGLNFFKLVEEFDPSWYSGVPTMHQIILNRAASNVKIIEKANFRFIRSSSASLPIKTLLNLEKTFGCPVIEAYGMTEAAHQMTSNLLPPMKRIPGSVGVAAGPEVAVVVKNNEIKKRNATGEIVIRGDNVFKGYLNNSKANSNSFLKGWFRTGDEGKLDPDGFLTITGRLKEIINRGGEKIMPKEVDEVILKHPNVEQAVTFSVPHEKLGEEIGLALVLKENHVLSKKDVVEFCKDKLAKFKVPTKILFVKEIPKGSTGKLQRIGLAKKLGL